MPVVLTGLAIHRADAAQALLDEQPGSWWRCTTSKIITKPCSEHCCSHGLQEECCCRQAKLASEIADIEIPETFKPTSSGDIDAIFMKMKMVAYERDEGNGLLMLMHMEISVGGAAQQRAEMRQQMNQQDMGQRNLIIKNSETR